MNLDFNLFCLLFIGYFVHYSSGGSGKHEKVHVKIQVPEFIKHHHHTKVVLIHKPSHHKAEPKKPAVVHHHHHHKHNHGHNHKHGHKHGHKHKHAHKHKHVYPHKHHHHAKKPHHHHHHKKHKYITKERVVHHYPGDVYRESHKSLKNERLQSHTFRNPGYVPSNYFATQNSYHVKENADDFTTSGYDGLYQYPPLSGLLNQDAEYIGPNSNLEDYGSSEDLTDDVDHENVNDYASDEHYEAVPEAQQEGYFDYEEETRRQLVGVGPESRVLVTKKLSVGDKNGRITTVNTDLI